MRVYMMQVIKFRSMSRLFATNKTITRSDGRSSTTVAHQKETKSYREVPGPLNLPFIGPLHNYLPGGKLAGYKGVDMAERLYKLYGPIVKLGGIFGGCDTVFLFDPNPIAHILRSEDTLPVRIGFPSLNYYRQRYKKTYDPERITGVGTDHGKLWKKHRSIVNPVMMQPKTIKLYSDAVGDIADAMVARIRSIRDKNNQITENFAMEMNRWALESIGVVAVGTRLGCLDPQLSPDSPAAQLLENIPRLFHVLNELDYEPSLWRYFPTPAFRKGMKVFENHERLTRYFIEKAQKKYEMSNKSTASDSEKSILEKLLDVDVEIAVINATETLLGGMDTTSNTVTSALYLLATNPEKQNKLREEILCKDDKKPYLKACIKETLRVLPPSAIGNARLTTKEYNVLGYKIPKNVVILFAQHYMPLMEEHYPRPGEFIPERWLAEKEDPLYYGNTNPFVLAPWGFGVRTCIGRRIAELEMETLISKVIKNFQVEWASNEPIQRTPRILNYVKEPVHLVFKDITSTNSV